MAKFAATGIKEEDRGWTVNAERTHQCRIQIIIIGHVCLQGVHLCQPRQDVRMRKCVFLHFLAGDAPVCVKVEHAGTALLPGVVQCKLQSLLPLDLSEAEVLFDCGTTR